jgi:hypothetical protein
LGTYIEELRVVLLAVNDRFTHFGFCVGHGGNDRDGVEIDSKRERRRREKEGKREDINIEKIRIFTCDCAVMQLGKVLAQSHTILVFSH